MSFGSQCCNTIVITESVRQTLTVLQKQFHGVSQLQCHTYTHTALWPASAHTLQRTAFDLRTTDCTPKMGNRVPYCSGMAWPLTCNEWNVLAAVEDFRQLHREMEGWKQVPREVRTALTPERAVRHAEKMLGKDNRMRVFKPRGSQYGAMFLCQQAHVDLVTACKSAGRFLSSMPALLETVAILQCCVCAVTMLHSSGPCCGYLAQLW